MLIYDQTTLAFMQKCEGQLRTILSEIGLEIKRNRFLFKGYLYPTRVVIFEGSELGHFNAPYLQIGLNRKLIYLAKDSVIKDLLRHELAHYLTYLHHGQVQSHGLEFKAICERYGFPQDIAASTIDLNLANDSKVGNLEADRILEKVKKLLHLAQSSNVHEAELATIKANELLLRHNLKDVDQREETVYLERVMHQSRKDAKLSAVYEIIRHFIVRPVISSGKNACCIEISGSHTNVSLAKYVADFLERELDHLWNSSKKEYSLSGLRAKNSFFAGVARGFEEKMKQTKANFSEADKKALVVVEKRLEVDTRIVYQRLSSIRSHARIDGLAKEIGILKGKDLTIRRAVESSSGGLYLPSPRS